MQAMFFVVDPLTPRGPYRVTAWTKRGGEMLAQKTFDTHEEALAYIRIGTNVA